MGSNPSASSEGAGAEQLRRRNLSTLLGHVHISGPTTRSRLAALTGLNRSTIADLVGELSALDLVVERRAPTSAGPGRPSPVVAANPEGAVVLAIELAVDSIAVATIGLGGHVYNRVRIDRPRGRFSPSETVEDAVKLAEPLLASVPVDHHFAGVGVAVVGLTRRADGFVHLAPNLGWRDVPLGEMLAGRLGLDVAISVANEADLGALCEHLRGVSPGVANLLFVSGEVGIGVGVILGGTPGTRCCRICRRGRPHLGQPGRCSLSVRGDRVLGDGGWGRRPVAPCRPGGRRRGPGVDRSRRRRGRGR